MVTADKGPEERKQEREANLVGRDKASAETTEYILAQLSKIDNPDVAKAVAMLNEQINDNKPPEEEPFGYWYATLSATVDSVSNITSSGADVTVNLTEFNLYDTDASVHLLFREQDPNSIHTQVVETPSTTMSTTGTTTISTDSLNANTDYTVQVVAEATVDTRTDTEYSDRVEFGTKQ